MAYLKKNLGMMIPKAIEERSHPIIVTRKLVYINSHDDLLVFRSSASLLLHRCHRLTPSLTGRLWIDLDVLSN